MTLSEFKKAQSLQIEMLAYRKLAEMLKGDRVVLTSSNEKDDLSDINHVFAHLFGEDERRELNGSIKENMVRMVNNKISELESDFELIGIED